MSSNPVFPTTTSPFGPAISRKQAQQVLRANDRGGYTIPSPRLYPFQWNWDSAVTALGWMTFDEPRAWRELERLFEGQWKNGMLPHIVFHVPADTYFPGPGEWGVEGHTPPTSSITQPPLAASLVKMMSERASNSTLADRALKQLLPRLLAWHRWWYRERDPEQTGLVVTYHPWESGLDNSPAWDAPLSVVPATTRAYTRRDTGLIDPARRPRPEDYDRYVYLMDFIREAKFDPVQLYAECPYRVADFGLNIILLRATEDLAELCRRLGDHISETEMRAAAGRSRDALNQLWSPDHRAYASVDTRTSQMLTTQTHSTFLAWYGRLAKSAPVNRSLLANLHDWLARTPHGLASTHPDAPEFEPLRYWRGPIWPHINWLIGSGLAEAGHHAEAMKLRNDTRTLIATGGFREYFNPLTGEACGGADFSWTAAVALFWCASESVP